MPIYVFSGGQRRELTDPKVFTGGTRKDIQEVYAYTGGTRKLVWFRQPLELAAAPQNWEQIQLTITPPGSGADNYVITRGGVQTYTGTGTSYLDTGRLASTTYTYMVTATRAGVQVGQVTTQATTPARGDMGLVAGTTTWQSVPLTWSDPDVGSVNSYALFRGGVQTYTGATKAFTDTGLDASITYSYEVRALRSSEVVGTDTTVATTPVRPPMTLTPSNLLWDRVTLNWTDPGGGADSFRLLRGATQVYAGGATSFTDTLLLPGTAYSYTIQAVRGGVVVGSLVEALTTPVRADVGLTATSTKWNLVALAWTDTSGGSIDNYKVFRGATEVYSGATKSFSDTGRTESTAYSYTLRSYRAGVEIDPADTASATTPARAAMTLVTSSVLWDRATLTWTDPEGDATSYVLKRGTTTVYSGTAKTFTDTVLNASTAYTWTVEAILAAATIGSRSASATTPAYADLGLSASSSVYHQVGLSWSAKNGSIDRFLLYRGGTLIYNGLSTSITDGGLAESTGYSYTLYAQRSEATVRSDTASATTPARPTSSGSIFPAGTGSGYYWTQSTAKTLTGPNWSMPVNGYVTAWNLRLTGYGTTGSCNPHLAGNYLGWRDVGSTGTGAPGWSDHGAPAWWGYNAGTYSSGCTTGGQSPKASQWQPYSGGGSTTVAIGQINYWYYTASWVTKEGVHLSTHTDSWCDESGAIYYERAYDKESGALVHERGDRPDWVPEFEGPRLIGVTWHEED